LAISQALAEDIGAAGGMVQGIAIVETQCS
jgi:hypothetical protein